MSTKVTHQVILGRLRHGDKFIILYNIPCFSLEEAVRVKADLENRGLHIGGNKGIVIIDL
jgi:polyribonucleotide nucleotidyltransferase